VITSPARCWTASPTSPHPAGRPGSPAAPPRTGTPCWLPGCAAQGWACAGSPPLGPRVDQKQADALALGRQRERAGLRADFLGARRTSAACFAGSTAATRGYAPLVSRFRCPSRVIFVADGPPGTAPGAPRSPVFGACTECGTEDKLYDKGHCPRCSLHRRARELLVDPAGTDLPALAGVLAITATRSLASP